MNTPDPEPIHPVERNHHPVALPALTKDAPARLFFGGSFDPPHTAHIKLPILAAQTIEQHHNLAPNSCHLVYVPAARSPFKDQEPTPDQHRIEMLKRALADIKQPNTIWTQELADGLHNPDQPSYWADTWSIARSMTTAGINRFLIGADQAKSMHHWHRYQEFWKDAVVLLREEDPSPESAPISPESLIEDLKLTGAWSQVDIAHWTTAILQIPTLNASSTDLRTRLTDPATRELKTPELSPGVHEYILEHKLYL
ncbi:MAG: nicotinate-nicotinamide nucleotide adenylyltransferase [Phycisphaerales bacterium]|nr:nicotinate-nicotinamide nucleotide adenylyltransferase [Phycisphaerales bacterium]